MLQSVEEAAVARIVVFDSFDELVGQSSEATVLNIEETLQTNLEKNSITVKEMELFIVQSR